jgi:transposase
MRLFSQKTDNFECMECIRMRGKPLTIEEKWIVHHVFEMFQKDKEQGIAIIEDPYSLTSKYTGVARSIVAKIAKSVRETGDIVSSEPPGNRMQSTLISQTAEGRIREFIFEKHRQGSVCNATHVKALLKAEYGLEVNERTVRRHLIRMGFYWLRTKNRPRSLREKAEIRQQRHDYLYEIRKNRQAPKTERYNVVYSDESFLHHHHAAKYSWFSECDFVERFSGKGRRWCFIHAIQEKGLVNGAFLIFEAKQGTGDYHKQFDYNVFHRWFREQLLPNLPSRCLIVLDRCPFHMVAKESVIPRQMKKTELRNWLTTQGFSWEERWLRERLIEEVEKYRDRKPLVEIFAEEKGHKILFLPTHHPELNPIELVWSAIKNDCGKAFSNSTSFKDQRQHLEGSLNNNITPEYCLNTYRHVQEIEEKYWNSDLIIDEEIEIEEDDSDSFYL